jgi:hypothetical protein
MGHCAPIFTPGTSMKQDQPRSVPPPVGKDEIIAEANKTREQLESLLNEVLELILQTKQLASELAAKCDAARRDKPPQAS